MWWWFHGDIYIFRCMCSLLYINYISILLFKNVELIRTMKCMKAEYLFEADVLWSLRLDNHSFSWSLDQITRMDEPFLPPSLSLFPDSNPETQRNIWTQRQKDKHSFSWLALRIYHLLRGRQIILVWSLILFLEFESPKEGRNIMKRGKNG